MALSKERSKLLARLFNPRLRSREGQFVVEGVRGCREFLDGALRPEVRFAVTSPGLARTEAGRQLQDRLADSTVPVEEVSEREMELVSQTEQTQGVLMVVREPSGTLDALDGAGIGRVLLLDGIQDPGNVGTLIRAARAFGLQAVLALDGTADPFNAKVVRASAGALAHLWVFRTPWTAAHDWLDERGIPLIVADPRGEDIRVMEVPPQWALLIGNEGRGPRGTALQAASERVGIPMEAGVESLNAGVAGAILLFALSELVGWNRET
ncbi:MAG: RNA methyltransferase [Gemmatimonadetes bacterium]|nr:RNA methyltransferase [Gemmatimonadota bacterium]NNM05645.1 RNA methyltransferase [Gemmatimonadota bacterium]